MLPLKIEIVNPSKDCFRAGMLREITGIVNSDMNKKIKDMKIMKILEDYGHEGVYGPIRVNDCDYWYLETEVHRDDDLPAIERTDGKKIWCQHGKIHRPDDKPAIVYPSGAQFWYEFDELHRVNGPAAMYYDGRMEYYIRGKLHRIGGPAIVHITETIYIEEYYENGKRHRYAGPALIHENIEKYYINGYETILI